MKVTPGTAHFDQMCWPRAGDYLNELDWRLRYGTEVSRSDALMAASIISAYRALVWSTAKKRARVVLNLRSVEVKP